MFLFHSKDGLLKRHVSDLKNSDPEVRRRAAYKLYNLGKSDASPHLIRALTDPDKRVRWRVAYALGDFGETGHDAAFEVLVSHLDAEEDWNVRRIIVMALRHWDKRAIKPLINALSDESEYVRRYAAMTLGFKRSKEAVPPLKRLIEEDGSKEVRDYASWALEEIKKQD
ncbi:MAG: HEAT repeat domain-containing protein [Candidatus Hydrothermarchaeales archaeon]